MDDKGPILMRMPSHHCAEPRRANDPSARTEPWVGRSEPHRRAMGLDHEAVKEDGFAAIRLTIEIGTHRRSQASAREMRAL